VSFALKLLAPYLAVGLFWCVLGHAWLAILAYHVQILLWSRSSLKCWKKGNSSRYLWTAMPAALTGPLLYFLLPHVVQTDLLDWLSRYHLSGLSLILMIPYFGLIHPILEQAHWAPLRRRSPVAHVAFAGYHALVLHSLLQVPWLVACVLVLAAASFAWRWMTERSGSLVAATMSHILADLGMIVVACITA
jgi:hypothetical protein